jgi:YfaZ precursor
MQRSMALAATFMALAASTPGHAQDLTGTQSSAEIALSDETLQLRYRDAGRNVDVGGGRVSGFFFLSEERDIVLSSDFLFPAQLGYDRLQILFGPRAYAALLSDENSDVFAISLGAEIRYVLDKNSGFALSGEAFYAPDVLTFGTADNLTDLSARVEIRVQPRLTVFGGMRWFEFDLIDNNGSQTLQEELFAGLSWSF